MGGSEKFPFVFLAPLCGAQGMIMMMNHVEYFDE
jgi:hypothetical protein